ncbi:MAG: biopolymer transporter ExbD [Candidatus Krumholzibacteriota bacterium]|nr:biopolymer transporter ExbD [Candidatus Krumholzibacteriota bacterium]
MSTEFSAASMSDIAFLLLIFFLVTTIFALEMGIPLILPGKESTDIKVSRKNILEVKAYPNGTVVIDDKVVPLSQLRPLVERRLSANEKLIVVIQTHPDAEYGLMVDILDELKLAKCRRISLKTMKG